MRTVIADFRAGALRRLLIASLAAVAASAQPLAIRDVRVFDGEHVIARATVVIQGTSIAEVAPDAKIPSGAKVMDGYGKTLAPGFIDAHTHTIDPKGLKQAAAFGVTTTLDMFTVPANAKHIKQEEAAGKQADAADLFSAGYAATAPGGHGTEYGLPVPTLTSPGEAQAWVDARIAEGSDYIKIIYDDGVEYKRGPAIPTLSKETMKALIDTAHARGKLAVVHIGSLQQAEDAINAGADGLAHLFIGEQSDPNFGKLVAAHHAFVIPTLSVLSSLCRPEVNARLADDPRISRLLPKLELASLRRGFGLPSKLSCAGADQAVRQLKAAGVPILVGSDAGNPGTTQGATVHGEMELLVRDGLTPAEALRAATSAAAAVFRLEDRGRIAPGKRADLVLIDGDPTTDITNTRNIVAVWKAGHQVDIDSWRSSVEKERAAAEEARRRPAPPGSESGLVSDFEEDKPAARFGAGWSISTDAMMGGKSKATMEVAPGGANGSKGSLHATGTVEPGFAAPWAGVMFSPGAAPMTPANLSGMKAILFWTKGDGKSYRLMIFAQSRGFQPLIKTFTAGPEWKQVRFAISDFGGIDGRDIMAVIWAAGPAPGAFDLYLDDVRIE
jgi:imidazolonepropionase-like amidohydrolase